MNLWLNHKAGDDYSAPFRSEYAYLLNGTFIDWTHPYFADDMDKRWKTYFDDWLRTGMLMR